MRRAAPARRKTLLVRADGGARVGLGHLVRSLSLGAAWRALGGRVVYAIAPELAAPFRRLAGGRPLIELVEERCGSAADARRTIEIAARHRASWILLDGYRFDIAYRATVRAAAPVALLDDVGDLGPYLADALINHNAYARPALYAGRGNRLGLLLLGARYALLRPVFCMLRARRPRPARKRLKLLVTLGGGSARRLLAPILEGLAMLPEGMVEAAIVVGPADPDFAAIRAAAARHAVGAIRGGPQLPRLLAQADLVLAAAGSVSWELCCLGMPSILVVTSADQRRIASELEARGAAVNLGAVRRIPAQRYAEAIRQLAADPRRRLAMSRRARTLIDGRGAERAARALWRAAGRASEAAKPAS